MHRPAPRLVDARSCDAPPGDAPPLYALGFSRRKQPFLRHFLGGRRVHFVTREADVPDGADLAVWGSAALSRPQRPGAVLRVEDGFLRSVGLGAAFARPSSWVLDRRGIHYDASQPSDLEDLLRDAVCDDALLGRAAALRQRLVAARLTKYNLGGRTWQRPPGGRTVCLAVGQVESDASLARGSPHVRSNLALVQRVRALRPDAHLVYKPHPDVVAGLRAGGRTESEIAACCDEIAADVDISALFDAVDELHVMTSLAGFEALLRRRQVVTHGRPFYAGWGLTQDLDPPLRRGRARSLDELVACTLLLYPRYIDARGHLTEAEAVLDELFARREGARLGARAADWAGRLVGQALRALRPARA